MDFEAILFDLGNTLVTRTVKEKNLMLKALEKIDLKAKSIISEDDESSLGRLSSIYVKLYRDMYYFRETFLIEIPIDVWLNNLLIQTYDERIATSIMDFAKETVIEARSSFVKTFDKVTNMLTELKKDYQLGIISNVSSEEVVYQIVSDLNIDRFFEVIITSAGFGVRKPYPGIFYYALRGLGVEKIDSVIFVGDSMIHDIKGAKKLGMKTILISNYEEKSKEADITIDEVRKVIDVIPNLR
ncbi:MAG: HAD family hydrolase [Candidatus Bathyarchaeota archaeon]|nr:HAD family hydrolase [Candidatus Bathyarchaeota archaeon]